MYKITIQVGIQKEPGAYWSWEDIYEQQVDDLDVKAVVDIVNTDKKN